MPCEYTNPAPSQVIGSACHINSRFGQSEAQMRLKGLAGNCSSGFFLKGFVPLLPPQKAGRLSRAFTPLQARVPVLSRREWGAEFAPRAKETYLSQIRCRYREKLGHAVHHLANITLALNIIAHLDGLLQSPKPKPWLVLSIEFHFTPHVRCHRRPQSQENAR